MTSLITFPLTSMAIYVQPPRIFFSGQDISDNHPAVEILHDLETISYYVDKNSSDYVLRLARYIIQAILRWADMLNCRLKVGTPYVL